MGIIVKPTTLTDGVVPTAAQFNGDYDTIYTEFNGNIDNSNIKAGAAIAASKISGTAATLTGPNVFTGKNTNAQVVQTGTTYSPAAGGTATLDLSLGNFFYINMPAGNITIALSNVAVNQPFTIRILQDSGGSRTVSWFTTIKWSGGGTAPTLTTTTSKADTFGFVPTSAGNYDGYVVGQNI